MAVTAKLERQRPGDVVGDSTLELEDILDRQREMINAQVKFIHAEREGLVRAYELLASIGYLTAKRLRLPVERYDPLDYHRRQRDRWFGTNLTAD